MTREEDARTDLQRRVAAAEERNQRRLARHMGSVGETAANAVKDHPFASLATGVAAGILLASILPRRVSGRGSALIMGVVTDIGVNIARKAWKNVVSARQAGQGDARNLGDAQIGTNPSSNGKGK